MATSADPVAIGKKAMIYVGGLDEAVDERTLAAAFVPFGDLQQVQLPKDGASQKHRGFGYVEFVDPEDAAAAVENMHESELFGRVIKCNLARPTGKSAALWAGDQADQWYGNLDKTSDDVDAAIQHHQLQDAKARATK